MESSIFRFALKYSLRQQITLLVVTLISFPFLYYSYELPKLIVNHIKDVGEHVLENSLESYPAKAFNALQLEAVPYLLLLCVIYLLLVIISGGFKYFINVYKGQLGERMLRRLRYRLYSRVLRFPLPQFRKVSQGEIIPMVTAEVEPLGGFIGDVFVQPLFQGGLLLVPLVFIMVQDPILGLTAIALYPLQMYIIPKLQRRVNMLAKERVRVVRKLSDRIGETVSGIQEIHANDASNAARADFVERLGTIYGIRYRIYRLKFFAKYLNNSIDKLTPFFFYSIGGYLVFQGRLDLGALVAVIAAQKDLGYPWKELLAYYQQQADARIKYDQVVEQFQPPELLDEALQTQEPAVIEPLSGDVVATRINLVDEAKVRIVNGASFQFGVDQHVALVGGSGSGKEEIGQILARLLNPTDGQVTIGGKRLESLPEAILGRRIGYVGQNAYLFSASLGDNLFFGLGHRPLRTDYDPEKAAAREAAMVEAERAGNPALDVEADWIDFESAGASSMEELTQKAFDVLRLVGLDEDTYQLGRQCTIDPAEDPDLAGVILKARAAMREQLSNDNLAQLVEPFDTERYNSNATVGENLLFGTPVGPTFQIERLAENDYILETLEKVDLTDDMLSVGWQIADTMVELFADLQPGHEIFEQFSFIDADDLPELQALRGRVGQDKLDTLKPEDRRLLLSLPFKLIPARHRLGLIDDRMQQRLLEARALFAKDLPSRLHGTVEFFDSEKYNAAATLQDNILFGKLAYGQAGAEARVSSLINDVLDDLDLRSTVMEVGFSYQVGIAGSRLNATQRRKLAIARAMLKRPDMLIINDSLAVLDGATQQQVLANLRSEMHGRCLVAVLHRASLAQGFDRIFVVQGGRVVEEGGFDDLDGAGGPFQELLHAD